jgi:cytidine deaminase
VKPDLDALAIAAQKAAHAPYSKFRVGAVVEMSDGSTYSGANIENASYGLAICAERTAVFAAVLAGRHQLSQVVVASDSSPPASPCGACRQVLYEFAPDPDNVTVTSINAKGERRSWTLAQLLPEGFTGKELP